MLDQIWSEVAYFLEVNPELKPVLNLLAGFVFLYVVILFGSWSWIHLRKGPPPYIDQIVHGVTFAAFVLMSVAVIAYAVWAYLQPQHLMLWYHWLTYAVLAVGNIMGSIALVPHLREG